MSGEHVKSEWENKSLKKSLGGVIRQKNQARILTAAADEFVKHGFKGTSIQAIADRVELPKANVLYYFKSKSGLYKTLLADILDMWNQGFSEQAASQDPAVVIRDYIVGKMRYSRSNPQCSKIFAMEMIQGAPNIRDALDLPVIEWTKSKANIIQSWVDRGAIRPVEPLYLLFLIWSATQFYADFDSEIDLIKGQVLTDSEFQGAELFLIEQILTGLGLQVPQAANA
jgi:TetR/AcrR family transcriptional regulator